MEEQEDQQRDNSDIEITDLDEAASAGATPVPTRVVDRTYHLARQHKRPFTIATVALILLVIMLVLVSTSAVRELAGRFLSNAVPAPSPTQPLYPGENFFYVQADPSWGHLTIDGRPIQRLPVVSEGEPLMLARGQHELVWSAAPFQVQRCFLSVPRRFLVDTCVDHSTVETGAGITASIVSFQESLTTLPENQRNALIEAVRAELNARQSTETVRTGELYALSASANGCKYAPGEPLCYAVARQPLLATLQFQLDTNAASSETCLQPELGCTYLHESCYTFCSLADTTPGAANVWDVLAPVLPSWIFQTPGGKILGRGVPDNTLWDFATGDLADESLTEFHITWQNQAWQIDSPVNMIGSLSGLFNPVCAAAQNIVTIQEPPTDSFGDPFYLQWQYTSGTLPASGCLGVGSSRQDAGNVQPTVKTSPALTYFLLRFGVLLAANAQAHHLFPHLPVADAYEQQLAKQLATQINGNS